MLTKRRVDVHFDEVNTLTFDPSEPVQLEAGDWVEWNFTNAPPETLPIIEFDSPLGPFQCVQSVADDTVRGKGNIGEGEGEGSTYSYTAFLLTETGVRAQSRTSASVVNLPQPKNTSPVVTVHVSEHQAEGDERTFCLDIVPDHLMLFPGDTALWNVFGLPPEHFITFQFEPPPGLPNLDPLVGPFDSLLANRRVGAEEANVMRVVAANFRPEHQSQFIYMVAVRNASGTIQTQHEPVIDNLGQPPTGGA